jgi:two-component system, LytTR family, response regulator AlgR
MVLALAADFGSSLCCRFTCVPPAGETVVLRVLIVDDETLAVDRLGRLCARIDAVELAGTAGDGETALRQIEELEPDVVLLDISMPGLDGMALARLLASRACCPAIVFVTAYDAYAVAAFELAATDYLLKPVSLPRLELAMKRAAAARPATKPYLTELWAPRGREMVRVAVEALDLVEAERDYARLHARGHAFLLRITLQELERRLDPARFVRVHRSAIIAIDRIRALRSDDGGAWTVHLLTGQSVRVGRSFRPLVQRLVGRST